MSLFDNSITPLFYELARVSKKFYRFYKENSSALYIGGNGRTGENEKDTVLKMRESLNTNDFYLKLVGQHRFFKTGEDLNFSSGIEINLDVTKYVVTDSSKLIAYEKTYNQQLTDEEIKALVNLEAKKHKEFIESHIATLENN